MSTAKDLIASLKKKNITAKDPSYLLIHQIRYLFILNKIISLAEGKKLRILDVGCFPYHIGESLEKLGHTVYGIASEHEPIDNPNIAVVNIETEQFPFKSNFFDMVLCNEVVEHLPQSPIPPLRELHRVTKKEGLLMVTTPNITRSINRGKLLLGKNIMYPIEVFLENNGKGNTIYHRHNREYTLDELTTLIQKSSWTIKETGRTISYTPFREKIHPDPVLLFLGKLLNYWCMLLVPSLRDTLFVIGKKSS